MEEYTANVPIYLKYSDLRTSVKSSPAQTLKAPGKIYYKDNYIFINELMKGIHIIDNSNTSSPVFVNFVEIPGNTDIAIKNNTLYADSYVDIICLDISNISNIKEVNRIQNKLPYMVPETGNEYRIEPVDKEKGVVIGWNVETVKKEYYEPNYYPFYNNFEKDMLSSSGTRVSSSGDSYGIAGSMARFLTYKDVLYIIDSWDLHLIGIENETTPVDKGSFYAGWSIESLFINNNTLFIGAQNGMSIYDLNNPLNPVKLSEYSHITSCDPVVVENNRAYLTLRTGNNCNRGTNELQVIDISDLSAPSFITSYSMTNPHGLAIDNSILFVCDGSAGLKIYNASDDHQISTNIISSFPEIQATDVIPLGTVLLMIGEDGFYQYDYSDLNNISLLSKIEVEK